MLDLCSSFWWCLMLFWNELNIKSWDNVPVVSIHLTGCGSSEVARPLPLHRLKVKWSDQQNIKHVWSTWTKYTYELSWCLSLSYSLSCMFVPCQLFVWRWLFHLVSPIFSDPSSFGPWHEACHWPRPRSHGGSIGTTGTPRWSNLSADLLDLLDEKTVVKQWAGTKKHATGLGVMKQVLRLFMDFPKMVLVVV